MNNFFDLPIVLTAGQRLLLKDSASDQADALCLSTVARVDYTDHGPLVSQVDLMMHTSDSKRRLHRWQVDEGATQFDYRSARVDFVQISDTFLLALTGLHDSGGLDGPSVMLTVRSAQQLRIENDTDRPVEHSRLTVHTVS